MTTPRSARTSTVLLVVGAVFLWTAFIVGGAARGILRPDPFARRLAATLSDTRVSGYVSERITDAIVAQRPNLVSVRSIIEPTVNGVVASAPFRAVVRTSARTAHRALFESAAKNVVLSLPDVSVLVRGALSNVNPELAAKIPPGIEAGLASPEAEAAFNRFIAVWSIIGKVLWGAWALLLLGFAAVVAAVWKAPDRQTALVHAGAAFMAVALGLLAVLPAGRVVAAAITPDHALRGVIHGVWSGYFLPVKLGALIAGSIGIVLVSAGSTMLEALDPFARLKALGGWLTAPLRPVAHVGRAILLLAAGTFAAVAPSRSASYLAAIAGLVLVYLGLREVFRLVLSRAGAGVGVASVASAPRTEARAWRVVAAVAAVLTVVIAGGALLVFGAPAESAEASGVATVCNGSARLCNRRLDQVVVAGSHNSMSNAEIPGWLFPNQNRSIPHQLEDGVRALAIDLHYGIPADDRVITDLDREGTSKDKIEGYLGPEATAAALRIRERFLGKESGPSAVYFCHGFCELGAYPAGPTLEGVREFMVGHPGEVLVIVVEDYITPQDVAMLFQDAGLVDLVYTGPITPAPTLRHLIDLGQRIVVFSESGRPGVPWLRPAWDVLQETPYTFHKPADFSCRPNRGGANAPFFQINHWIETTPTPKPSNAEIVNAYDFLLGRARACREQRGRLPNVVSVDFSDVGDLVRVVNTLNGLDRPGRAGP